MQPDWIYKIMKFKYSKLLFAGVVFLLIGGCYSPTRLANADAIFVQCSTEISPIETNKRGYKEMKKRQKILKKHRKHLLKEQRRNSFD